MAINRRETGDAIPEGGPAPDPAAIRRRVEDIDWAQVHGHLDAQGWAMMP
jgi:hypothetical protein